MDIDISRMALCQMHTEVGKDEAGVIFIQQADPQTMDYYAIEIQPYFLPLFVSWLQELIAPEAVG